MGTSAKPDSPPTTKQVTLTFVNLVPGTDRSVERKVHVVTWLSWTKTPRSAAGGFGLSKGSDPGTPFRACPHGGQGLCSRHLACSLVS